MYEEADISEENLTLALTSNQTVRPCKGQGNIALLIFYYIFFFFCSLLLYLAIQHETKRTEYWHAPKGKVLFYILHPSSKWRQNANTARSLMIGFSWLNRAHVCKAWLIQMDARANDKSTTREQRISFVWQLSTRTYTKECSERTTILNI